MVMSVARKERRDPQRRDRRRRRPLVVSRHGKHRFQTGMVTARLINRGLSMADARDIARRVRDSIAELKEISGAELAARITRLVEEKLGPEVAGQVEATPEQRDDIIPLVETALGRFPFSKGVVLRHLDTSGLSLDAAIELVADLERWVRQQGQAVIPEDRLHCEVAQMLDDRHGHGAARRYRLTDWVSRAPAPVVILIGGATGTGKSTLAMELAYRLGFVWVTSTDMIRETMRMTLPADLVPGLHDHSFRGILLGGHVLSDPRERVLAGFRQQAAQVAVGVRAVIQRAILENSHIIIEGTHIMPPFEQFLPAGAEANVAGFILAVPDEVSHRSRFDHRSRRETGRSARTYLDSFQSVRWIHDDLLRTAEESEAVVLTNVERGRTLIAAVDFLSRELPVEEHEPADVRQVNVELKRSDVPTLFLILDGLGDEPNPALGGKTPLAAAHTPVLRRLAASGGQGQVLTTEDDVDAPATDHGMLALLGGQREWKLLRRGAFEALGQGLPIPPEAVLVRGNLATAEPDGSITDRRVGRIREGVNDLLADLREVELSGGIVGRIVPSHEHRVLVMLIGSGLSPAVSDTDPGDRVAVQRISRPRPLDDTPEAGRTADALQELLTIAATKLAAHPINAERLAQGRLPANAVITRGAASAPKLLHKVNWLGAMVAGCHTALGVARYVGLKTANSVKMTGNLDTDLDAKFEAAGELLDETDFVVVHIKGTDVAGHDRRPLEKRDFISAVDVALGKFLAERPELSGNLRVVVSADHATSSISGTHLPDPVPLLLATYKADNEDEADFDEESSGRGALGVMTSRELAELLGLTRTPVTASSLHPPPR